MDVRYRRALDLKRLTVFAGTAARDHPEKVLRLVVWKVGLTGGNLVYNPVDSLYITSKN
jgi:hypothetical protein